MDTSANITAAVFAAYLKCPTKAYLTAHGENPADTFVADTRGRPRGLRSEIYARRDQAVGRPVSVQLLPLRRV
jgi:hypothetical protein